MLCATGTVLLPTFLSLPEGPEKSRPAAPLQAPIVEAFIREQLAANSANIYATTHNWLAGIAKTPTDEDEPGEVILPTSREHILSVLDETSWVLGGPNGAAARLGMKRSTLQWKMKRLGISPSE
jgi:transcriptional regulator with GAF, ATPase, and Fis domain